MLATTRAQANSKNTNLLLNTIQGAFPDDGGYLKAKVTVKGFELNANVPIREKIKTSLTAISCAISLCSNNM
jgi:hypothetical protein